ncbi:hypothetical protein [Aliihoeflea sp. 2WW]|jgi:hypothetical protein|uniref:hypothetical protein n=1 Tax=Aliihoeflea sp. 2WW TaxID=1381123 RepID=UPI000465C064|nr:hypothetical protein [Aliihoeflea sp. 2WW]
MIDRLQSVALRIVIACAMAVSLLLAPTGGSSSHDAHALAQIEAERHLELAVEIAEHGHLHDDGWDSESKPGHLHGHNAADHLHDTPTYPPSVATLFVRTIDAWRISAFPKSLPVRIFELDRPPRA